MKIVRIKKPTTGISSIAARFNLVLIAAVLVAPLSALATGYAFINTAAGSDDWSNLADWDPNGAPVSSTGATVAL